MRFTKRLLSALLAFAMVFTMLPLQAYASEGGIEDRQESANFGGFVNPAPETRSAEKIQIPVGGEAQISKPLYVGKWEVVQNDKIIDYNTDFWGNLDIEGLNPGTATVKYVGSIAGTTRIYTVEVTEKGSKNTFTVNTSVSNASVAYATNIEGKWSDIRPVTEKQLVFNNFANKSSMGYVVFFVKGTSDHLITGMNPDGAGDIYPIGGGYGAITGYPDIGSIARQAAAQGYQACFGYSKSKEDLPQELGFTVAGQRPEMTMSAEVDKTLDVIPGDKLKFTVTIRPDQELAGRKLTITDLSLTSLKINGIEVSHGKLTPQGDGTYVVEVDYTATEEVCLQGRIQLSASASVKYSYSLTADQATVTTSVTVTASATAECAIGARKGVNYFYQYDAPEGVQPPSNIPAAPVDEKFYFDGGSVTVKASPNSPVMDDVNGGKWIFDGWYLGDAKYAPGDKVTMRGERLNFAGTWEFVYTLHKATFEYQNAPGSITAPAPMNDLHKGDVFKLPAPAAEQLDGYEFDGWELENKIYQPDEEFSMPNKDVTFTGSFSVPEDQRYAVRANIYLGNKGNGTPLATKDKVELTWEQLQAYYDMQHYQLANEFWNLTLNSNDDLNHSHWETNRKDANRVYNGGETDEEFHIVNIYLNADSTALVTLTYNANGEDVTGMPEQLMEKYLKGTVVTVAPAPTRDNYRFTEWNTDADGNGTGYPVGSTIKLTDATTTLYAQWTPMTAEYKVQYLFQKADGSGYEQHDEVKDRTFNGNIGDEIDPLSHKLEPNPEGYTLNEQKIAEQGEITVEQTNTVVCVYYDRKTYEITYALEGENQPSVTLPQKGTGRYGATINIAGDLSADGYNFTGWYTKEDAKVRVGENDDTFDMPAGDVKLYGTFSKKQVTVTYAAEAGGLVTDPKSDQKSKSFVETLSYGENAQGAVAVANEGYTFLGWKQGDEFVEQNKVIAPPEVKESVTYTAVFAKNYTVTYRVEGETGAYATQTHYAGEADVEVLDNAPAKTGYDFSGWKTEDTAVLNGKFTMPEQDVLFTGSYTAHTNLVWYVLEGDTKGCTNILEMPKQANYAYDTVMTVWMPELAEGYKFSGWTVEGAEIVDGKFSMPDNAVILTGTISKEQVKVDYKAQEGGLITDSNGLSDADLAEMVPYGENAKGATASAKMGYTFVEWQDANHKQVSTDPEFIPTNVTAPATYYAVFAKQKIKVEYTADVGGSITAPSGATFSSVIEQVTYGEDADGATASADRGYYFVEWQDAEGKQVGTELSFAPKNVTKEAVYKAVFAKYYAVNYVPVGTPEGTDLPQPENPYRVGDEVVLMDAPKVDGYKFEGWYKDADCTEKAENFVMPAEDVTIYGKFERAYKVTYRLNDGKNQFGINDKGYVIPHDFEPIAPAEYKAGEVVKVAQEQILVDVDFSGWRCIKGNVEVENGQFTMPAEDVVFEGYYMNREYVERHHFQDLYDQQKYKTWSGVIPVLGKEIGEMTEATMLTPAEMAIYIPEVTPEHVHLREPIVQKEILPFRKTVVDIYYDRDWYDVTYQLEGDVIPDGFTVPETKQHAYTATVTVAKAPQIAGYTFTGWTTEDAAVANGKFAMPNNAVTLTGKFELATDTKYTVEHYFENLGGGYPAEPNHTESKAGTTSQRTEAMPIPAGSITGFTVDGSWKQQTIKPDGSTVVKIYYTRNSYNLTVHYRNVGGAAVADSHHGTYKFGETWMVVSPIVAGYYDPQIRSISSGANGMPAQDLEYVVIYTAIPVPAPDPGPGPAPNPGPDDGDDDDDTPPVPDPEQEQPPQPQDFEIDPDDYTLTEVEDNETPLANLNLEGHTCCILHLLLMLAAMVVLGFDTKSRKKHQARIFELKKMLAMEEDHSDDPEQP